MPARRAPASYLAPSVTASVATVRPCQPPVTDTTSSRPVRFRARRQGILVRLRTRIAEEGAIEPGGHERREARREQLAVRVRQHRGIEDQLRRLIRDGAHHVRMAMPRARHGVTAVRVEPAVAIDVDDPAPLAARRTHGELRVDRKQCTLPRRPAALPPCRSVSMERSLHQPGPAVSSMPSARFIACTACPPAPFTRLSITTITWISRPSGELTAWMCASLVPTTCVSSGGWSRTRTNGRPAYAAPKELGARSPCRSRLARLARPAHAGSGECPAQTARCASSAGPPHRSALSSGASSTAPPPRADVPSPSRRRDCAPAPDGAWWAGAARPAPLEPVTAKSAGSSPGDPRERIERQLRRRGEASRRGDRRGTAKPRALDVGQPVPEAREQFGRRMRAVVPRIERRIGDAEVGGDVDDETSARGKQRRRHLRRLAMLQRQEHDIAPARRLRRARGPRRRDR